MPTLIVVNNPKNWPFEIEGVDVVDARSYLTSPEYGALKGVKLFNLCRSHRYQSTGYYVTLLAAARGHRPLPSIATFQDLRSRTMARVASEDLDELIQRSLARIQSNEFTLSIYFGHNLAKQHDRLARELFNLFQAPLLRARFHFEEKWHLKSIVPVSVGDIPDSHRDFLVKAATDYFHGKRPRVPKKKPAKYDLAILVDPKEELPPSDPVAIRKFIRAAEEVGLAADLLEPDDYGHLGEYDALFIRATTLVNHYTYRFARRAAFEELVVIDDPESIVKCSNKVFLAEILKRYNVPTPRTLVVHEEDPRDLVAELGLPLVLKKPDSSFSQGVIKIETEETLDPALEKFFDESDLIIAQEYLPTDYDWRIGVLDKEPLFACKYFMARGHWQIYEHQESGKSISGKWDTLPLESAPDEVVKIAVKAASLMGDGLYGVDLKQTGKDVMVIEVNDNPSIESGVEDQILKDELYLRIMQCFLDRIEVKRGTASV